MRDPKAFITIFEENLEEGTGAGKGLYLQGSVTVLADVQEIGAAKTLSTEKANRDRDGERREKMQVLDAARFVGDSIGAVYCFTPQRAWTNSWSSEARDSRVELDLEQLFSEQLFSELEENETQ